MKNPLEEAHKLWDEVKIIYSHLHKYTTKRLREKYGTEAVTEKGPIPVHLTRSLWADQWNHLITILLPYEQINKEEETKSVKSVNEILNKAQDLYEGFGFGPLPKSFWQRSIFIKPRNESQVTECHPLSFDFMTGNDFRIKMCLNPNTYGYNSIESELKKVIHELGHIQYFIAYRQQPHLYRSGANSAFHEAIGELMVLINNACKWKQFKDYFNLDQIIVKELMREALNNFVLLPWALTLEQWRHDLFTGQIPIQEANTHWWRLSVKIRGISPPVDGLNDTKIDYGIVSKYHVANFMPFLRYFFARFLAHQFHKTLCQDNGHKEEPLFFCCPKLSENFW